MKTDTMELNRETAMALWKKQFGKTAQAVDYAGRKILKAAYDDRGSAYGWNVDHILPKSRGGKTAEHNLICCHMETNSEKADKFPCFTANDTRFEIRKVQNHYEIVALGEAPVDFYNAEAGVNFWDKCCNSEDVFWEGYITICFDEIKEEVDKAFVSFVAKLFEGERISLSVAQPTPSISSLYAISIGNTRRRRKLLLRVHGLNRRKDTQRVLDLCVLLNTYMSGFHYTKGLIGDYSLYYEVLNYRNELEAFCDQYGGKDYGNGGLFISDSVKLNTDLKDEPLPSRSYSFRNTDYEYDFIFTDLKKELQEI